MTVRSPIVPGARAFVAAGIPRGDYNGRDRGGPEGVVSLLQTTTRAGKRASTYHAFLEGDVERRPNLIIITGAQATRIVLDEAAGRAVATGVEYRTAAGESRTALASREVVLSAGAIGSPHLLLLSGIGPREELGAVGVACRVESPHVGKHLKDHLQVGFFFPAPGAGVSMNEVGVSLGPAALRAPAGPLPADPAEDASLPPALQALKQEAERRITEWATTGRGLVSSSLYDACAWFSTGLGALQRGACRAAQARVARHEPQECVRVEEQPHLVYSPKPGTGASKSSPNTTRPLSPPNRGCRPSSVTGRSSATGRPRRVMR